MSLAHGAATMIPDDPIAGFTLSLPEGRAVACQVHPNADRERLKKDATAVLELVIDDGPTVSFARGAASMRIDEGRAA